MTSEWERHCKRFRILWELRTVSGGKLYTYALTAEAARLKAELDGWIVTDVREAR